MAIGIFANPVSAGFESLDRNSLPIEVKKMESDEFSVTKVATTKTTASLFDSTYAIVLFGLVGIYTLLLRKKESRGMNL